MASSGKQGRESPPLSNTTSEDDFWVSFEHLPVLSHAVTRPGLAKHRESVDPTRDNLEKNPGKELVQMENSIRILRAAKKVEVLNASLQAKNQAKVCANLERIRTYN
jgi:hypothetical protein